MFNILRRRDFARLWLGGLISVLGDYVLLIALPFDVNQRTGSALATSLTFLTGMLPSVLFGSLAGALADRWNRRHLLVSANLAEATVVLALLVYASDPSATGLWLVYAVQFLVSALGQLSEPAEGGLLPQLVEPGRLASANALGTLSGNIGRLIGPVLGGVLVSRFGLGSVVVADAPSFLTAAALIAQISVPLEPVTGGEQRAAAGWSAFWRAWREGFSLIRGDSFILGLLAVGALQTLGTTVRVPLVIPWAREVLQGGAVLFGAITSAQGIGGLIGGMLMTQWGEAVRPAILLAPSELVEGGLILAIVSTRSIPLTLGLVGIVGVAFAAFRTSEPTLMQHAVPDRYRGRAFGAFATTTALIGIAGYLACGALADTVGIVPTLSISSGLDIAAGLVALALVHHARLGDP